MKKFMKQGLALTMAVALAASPVTSVFAKTGNESQQVNLLTNPYILDPPFSPVTGQPDPFSDSFTDIISGKSTEETPNTPVIQSFKDVEALAKKKADTLSAVYGCTSVQYALIEDGKITLSGNSGAYSKETKTPLTNETMYGIGSVSKVYTTAAIMKLVEQGKVNLDSRVITYLPDFYMADKRYIDITVRMLLNHSSGLLGSSQNNALLFGDNDMQAKEQLLKRLQTQRLKADPGAFSVYCNDGFTMAELIVEQVSGMSFAKYIEQNFAKPLQLSSTKTPTDTFDRNLLAKNYYPGTTSALPYDVLGIVGAGGMYSTAEDLCRFATLFMEDSAGILSKESVAAMQNEEYKRGFWSPETDNTFNYGLGWDSVDAFPFPDYEIKALTKGGDTQFYHTSLIVLPEENMSVAVTSAGGASTYNQVAGQEILLAALKAKGRISEIKPYKALTPPINETMPADFIKYSGSYGFYGGIMNISVQNDGTLKLTPDGQTQSQEFTYGGNNRFYYKDNSICVSLEKGENGAVYLFVYGYSSLPGLGQTVTSNFQGQKLVENPISDSVKAAWKKRENNLYFIQNEKYSSQTYSLACPSISIPAEKDSIPGYVSMLTITDANTAKALLQIPGMFGRDLRDMKFFKSGNTEKLKYGDFICINEKDIPNLSTKQTFTVTVPKNGYALYYKIPDAASGKTITVSAPKKSMFTVYDSNGICINNSYITGIKKVTLPKDGYVILAGEAGKNLKLTYQK